MPQHVNGARVLGSLEGLMSDERPGNEHTTPSGLSPAVTFLTIKPVTMFRGTG